MTYTFKLSRRLAVARMLPTFAVALVAGCDVDPLGSADRGESPLALSPVRATAEPYQQIKMGFRDQVNGGLTPSGDVRWTVIGGAGTITPDGSFTASAPGVYTIVGEKGKGNGPGGGNGQGNNGNGQGNGGPAQTDTSTVVVVPPPATLISVEVRPDNASVEAGGHLQLEAIGKDSDGASAAIGVEWSATGGTIDGGGHYIAGATSGDFRVVARHPGSGLADTAEVTVVAPVTAPEPPTASPPSAPSVNRPNEPAGFLPVAEHHWPAFPNSQYATLGQWEDVSSSNYSVVSMTTPTGDGSAMQVRLPKGMTAGVSPGKFRFWRTMTVSDATPLQEMYVSAWIRIAGSDFENQAVGTKLFYWAYGNAYNTNDATVYLRGETGSQAILSQMQLFAQVSPGDNRDPDDAVVRNLYQNTGSSRRFTVGAWHHLEMVVNVGTPDRADGSIKIWLDGDLVLSHSDVKHLDSDYDFTRGFFQAEWAPIWGGIGGTRTRDDFMQVDQFYVSGVPQE
jgi:hypothetical protein